MKRGSQWENAYESQKTKRSKRPKGYKTVNVFSRGLFTNPKCFTWKRKFVQRWKRLQFHVLLNLFFSSSPFSRSWSTAIVFSKKGKISNWQNKSHSTVHFTSSCGVSDCVVGRRASLVSSPRPEIKRSELKSRWFFFYLPSSFRWKHYQKWRPWKETF